MNLCAGREAPLLPVSRRSHTYRLDYPEVPKTTSSSPAGGSTSLSLKAVEETKAQKPQDRAQSPWSCLLGRAPTP